MRYWLRVSPMEIWIVWIMRLVRFRGTNGDAVRSFFRSRTDAFRPSFSRTAEQEEK